MDEQTIFLQALEKDTPEERAAWLEEACGGGTPLRQRIEALLRRHEAAGSYLEHPPAELQVTLEPDSAHGARGHSVLKRLEQTLERVPRVVLRDAAEEEDEPIVRPKSPEAPQRDADSRYQLQGEIARGGMGAIFKGRDTDLGRDLAIKFLLEAHKDKPEVIQRFVEEAQIGGQLQHPGLAPLYEFGQWSDGRMYFSMKLVKGKTLAALLAARKNPAEDRTRYIGIFEQICQTMAYAHSRAVIHRDLKPANIMVGAFGEVQVMDWGLAKVLSEGGVADEKKAHSNHQGKSIIQTLRSSGSDTPEAFGSQTQMGSVMGTPAYMAPEQALGEVDRLDERSDVFGLGAILCEILTGRPPYVAEDATAVFRLASRGKLQDCRRRLEDCGADQELVAIALRCLELEPEDRPRNAAELSQQLTAHLESVEDRLRQAELDRVEAATKAVEERKRRKVLLALAASVLVTVCLAGGAWLWIEKQNTRLAEVEADERIAAAREKEWLAGQIDTALAEARVFRRQALSSQPPNMNLLSRASDAANKASALFNSGEVDAARRGRVKNLQATLARDKSEGEMLGSVYRLSYLPISSWDNDFELAAGYEAAFRNYLGGELLEMDRETAVQRLAASPIVLDLALALTSWSFRVRPTSDDWKPLLELARRVDDDPWCNQLRQFLETGEADDLPGFLASAPPGNHRTAYLNLLAHSLFRRERYADAELVLVAALVQQPDNWRAHVLLGRTLRRCDPPRLQESLTHAAVARALAPKNFTSMYNHAIALQQAGKFDEALVTYGEMTLERSGHWIVPYEEMLTMIQQQPAVISPGRLQVFSERFPSSLRSNSHPAGWEVAAAAKVAVGDPERIDEFRNVIEQRVESTSRVDPYALSALARLDHAAGQTERAIQTLERAMTLPDANSIHIELLAKFRRELYPGMASCASIDAALSSAKTAADDAWRQSVREARDRRPLLAAYLEGIEHQAAGDHDAATERLREAVALESREEMRQPEPTLRLVAVLRDLGKSDEAQRELGKLLGSQHLAFVDGWNLWLEIQFVDLRRSPADVLAEFPAAAQEPDSAAGDQPGLTYPADCRWLLGELAAGRTLRIRAGSREPMSIDGISWSSDRFFVRGEYGSSRYSGDIAGTDRDAVYTSHRWFPPTPLFSGYRIPLPPGTYRVTLHHTETWQPYARPGIRVFDVLLEGSPGLDDFDPTARAGFATAFSASFDVSVDDGMLDISIEDIKRMPAQISAIEIELVKAVPQGD